MPHRENIDIDGEGGSSFTARNPHGRQELMAALKGLYTLFEPLTMASVARRVGISEGAISHWLHGRRIPGPDILARFHAEASKIAKVRNHAAPLPLDQLLHLRHEATCTSSTCGDRHASPPTRTEGDRRNGLEAERHREGDRRNGQSADMVAGLPSLEHALALLRAGKRNEALPFLNEMALTLPAPDLRLTAAILLKNGQEGAAQTLLAHTSSQRAGVMVEMILMELHADARMRI